MTRILFVDDDQSIIDCYKDIFNILGYDIITVTSAEQTIEIFNDDQNFDAIIIDVGLPVKSGSELAALIKDKKPDQKVILTSGYTLDTLSPYDQNIINKFKDITFITKPFSSDDLIKALKTD